MVKVVPFPKPKVHFSYESIIVNVGSSYFIKLLHLDLNITNFHIVHILEVDESLLQLSNRCFDLAMYQVFKMWEIYLLLYFILLDQVQDDATKEDGADDPWEERLAKLVYEVRWHEEQNEKYRENGQNQDELAAGFQ